MFGERRNAVRISSRDVGEGLAEDWVSLGPASLGPALSVSYVTDIRVTLPGQDGQRAEGEAEQPPGQPERQAEHPTNEFGDKIPKKTVPKAHFMPAFFPLYLTLII